MARLLFRGASNSQAGETWAANPGCGRSRAAPAGSPYPRTQARPSGDRGRRSVVCVAKLVRSGGSSRTPASPRMEARDSKCRAAAGTVGAVSFVDIRPDAAAEPLEEPDGLWQDFADDYIGYVLDRIMRWGDASESGGSELLPFDPWLVRTGRQETMGRNNLRGLGRARSSLLRDSPIASQDG